MKHESIGLHVPRILIPRKDVDLTKWAVVACDQYTSQPEYWDAVENVVGSSPSTLRLVIPEAYLGRVDEEERIASIRRSMDDYLAQGILKPLDEGFVLVERTSPSGKTRRGLVVALDLERYDFTPGSKSLVRATEGTVMERLPIRVKIRSRASIEIPHTMVLIDDPEMSVIEPLFNETLPLLYDFPLMMNAGRLKGYHITEPRIVDTIASGLGRLLERAGKTGRQGEAEGFLFAVGDGNHSLAAAKLFWEGLKAGGIEGVLEHPARHALVELVNLHDRGLTFEPIHRLLSPAVASEVLDAMRDFFAQYRCEMRLVFGEHASADAKDHPGRQIIRFKAPGTTGHIILENAPWNLEVASLQAFLDAYCAQNPGMILDYIHGTDTLEMLCSREGHLGFFVPVIKKERLFPTIALEGALPRKAFSMGHAEEKRHYMECRKIVP